MSAETLRAVDDAIQAHLADETSGHIAAESMTDGTKSFYQSLVHESQPYHSTLGLVQMLSAEYDYASIAIDRDDD